MTVYDLRVCAGGGDIADSAQSNIQRSKDDKGTVRAHNEARHGARGTRGQHACDRLELNRRAQADDK